MKPDTYSAVSRRRVPVVAFLLVTLLTPPGWAAQARAGASKQAVVTVQGVQCPFCAYGVQKQLKKLPGVTGVDVELAKNQAIVTFAPDAKVTDADIQQAIRKAGFTPGKIEWKEQMIRAIERAGKFQAKLKASEG